MTENDRAAAVRTLLRVMQQGRSLNDALNGSATPLVKELVYGVTRWYWRLMACAELLLHKPLRKKDADVMMLVLVGLYQLIELRMPAHAAINETVNACEHIGKGWSKGLVNAVLRAYLRRPDGSDMRFSEEAEYCHPAWMIHAFRACWPAQWHEVIKANNEKPPLVLRVNRLRTDRATYLQQIEQSGLSAAPDPLCDDGIVMHTPTAVTALPGFAAGLVSVQDTAAQWAASLLPVAVNDRVLDACAAPGGKLTHVLEAQPKLGEITAIDVNPLRVELMAQNLQRLKLKAKTVVADAADLSAWWNGQPFNCILLDAPCSGTGVIRRRPDIKHLRKPGDVPNLVGRQAVLLDRLWQTLAPNGHLLYVTCSILSAENERQVEHFLSSRSDANVGNVHLPVGIKGRFGSQTLPGVHNVDGFFYALLRKSAG